jgi:hypothetical protein
VVRIGGWSYWGVWSGWDRLGALTDEVRVKSISEYFSGDAAGGLCMNPTDTNTKFVDYQLLLCIFPTYKIGAFVFF